MLGKKEEKPSFWPSNNASLLPTALKKHPAWTHGLAELALSPLACLELPPGVLLSGPISAMSPLWGACTFQSTLRSCQSLLRHHSLELYIFNSFNLPLINRFLRALNHFQCCPRDSSQRDDTRQVPS